jgi:hypothetical protein
MQREWHLVGSALAVGAAGLAAHGNDPIPSAAFTLLALAGARRVVVASRSEYAFVPYNMADEVSASIDDVVCFVGSAPLNISCLSLASIDASAAADVVARLAALFASSSCGFRSHQLTELKLPLRCAVTDADAESLLQSLGRLRYLRVLQMSGAGAVRVLRACPRLRQASVASLPPMISLGIANSHAQLTSLGDGFGAQSDIKTGADLPKSIQRVGDDVFDRSRALATVHWQYLKRLQSIGNLFCCSCAELSSVILPPSLRRIGNMCFSNCSSLLRIDLSETQLATLPTCFAQGCARLASVMLPRTLTAIGEHCLSNCDALRSVDLLHCTTLRRIDEGFGDWCPRLARVRLPAALRVVRRSFCAGTLLPPAAVDEMLSGIPQEY